MEGLGGVGALIYQLDEQIPIPWDVKISNEEHTVVVSVDCPEGTPVQVEQVQD